MTEKEIVDKFAKLMHEKIVLRHNRYAPMGWKTMDIKRVLSLLDGEVQEYRDAINAGDLIGARDEAIDIANYALFLYELCNKFSGCECGCCEEIHPDDPHTQHAHLSTCKSK